MIKAILFDLWNTLAIATMEWKEAYNEAGYHKCEKYDRIFEQKINTRSYTDEEELAEVMCEYFGGLDKEKVAKLLKMSKAKYFDDVKTGIKRLKEMGYLIGLISNTHNLETKKLKFDMFDLTILSSEVGMAKPDKRIFDLACKELNVKASECIFVGDNPRMDYEGSKKAGMKPVLIDRRGFHPDKEHIKNLFELIEVLEND